MYQYTPENELKKSQRLNHIFQRLCYIVQDFCVHTVDILSHANGNCKYVMEVKYKHFHHIYTYVYTVRIRNTYHIYMFNYVCANMI